MSSHDQLCCHPVTTSVLASQPTPYLTCDSACRRRLSLQAVMQLPTRESRHHRQPDTSPLISPCRRGSLPSRASHQVIANPTSPAAVLPSLATTWLPSHKISLLLSPGVAGCPTKPSGSCQPVPPLAAIPPSGITPAIAGCPSKPSCNCQLVTLAKTGNLISHL